MTTTAVPDLQQQFTFVANRVCHKGERIIVTGDDRPLFAVVPCEDAELLNVLEDRLDLDLAGKAVKRNDTVVWTEAKSQLGS